MNPSAPFVRRPVATTLLMVAIVLAGIIGARLMPVSALPEVDYPTIQVLTLYPGASPEVMSTTVTAPLERQFGQMPGLKRMSSTSASGASRVTLQFDLDLTLDVAEQEVQAAINAAASLLPPDLPTPPTYAKVNPADAPVLTLAVTSPSLPLTTVRDLVDARLAQKISQVPGVGLVNVSGGQRPAVRIQVDTQALASYGISLATLRTTIANANSNGAKGSFDGPALAYTIDANDQLLTPDDYKELIITYANGAPVHLSDVADVVIAPEAIQLAAWADRSPAIILDVQRQPGANVIQTVDAVHAQLPELLAGLPAGLSVRVLADRTDSIRASVHDVAVELALAVVLVVAVIFVFLRSVPATAVAALAVPISLTGTLGVVYLLGYSINNLTLMSLTIASGFVVDDAIVMIENIARYVRAGEAPLQAALKGARQIGFTIISLTVSLIAVLIPLLFMGDVVGRLFREFAVTLAISIVISAVVSLTLTPMLSARWLRRESPGTEQSGIARILERYDAGLGWVLAHQGVTLSIAAGTLLLTTALYVFIPKGLFPTQDTNQLEAQVRTASNVSFARMSDLQESVAGTLLDDPAVASVSSFVGVDGANTTALPAGRMFINLRPRADRDAQDVVMNRLRTRAAAIGGVDLYVRPVQDLTIDAETGPTQYQLSLEGADTAQVTSWATRLQDSMRRLPTLRTVVSDAQTRGLATLVSLDRDTAARIGLTAADLDDELYSAFGQRIISTIFTDTNQYRVILEAKPGVVTTPANLQRLHLQAGTGKATPLTAVARISQHSAPLQITRVAQFPAATIGFDTAAHVSLGAAVDSIRTAAEEIRLPPSLTLNFLGAPNAYEASLHNELWLIVAAVVCVYIVLGVLYESFVHPLTILSTLPSAGVGALLALLMTGNDLGVIGIIGLILLIGIVKKNAIMMIDFAIEAERGGRTPQDAIREAALLRFRPILMTTLAALFAAVPLMVGGGEGSELRQPLGIAIFGGLIASQLLTLFTTPVLYLAFDRLAQRWLTRATDQSDDATHGTETR